MRLADEVASLLKAPLASRNRPLTSLSFVCHSIGNLILRSALTCERMQPLMPKVWRCGAMFVLPPHREPHPEVGAHLRAHAAADAKGVEVWGDVCFATPSGTSS